MAITSITAHTFTDGFGNFYVNRMTANLNPLVYNAFSGTAMAGSQALLNTTLNTALTNYYGNRVATNTTAGNFFLLLNHPNEILTPPANTLNNRRFNIVKFYNSTTNFNTTINNSTNPNTTSLISVPITGTTVFSSAFSDTSFNFITCNQYSISQFTYDSLLRRTRFRTTGWLYQILPGTQTFSGCYDYYCESGYGSSNTTQLGFLSRRDNVSGSFSYDFHTISPGISCANSQNSNSVSVSNFLVNYFDGITNTLTCFGIMSSNVLLANSNQFELARLYRIDNVGENLNVNSNPNSNPNTDCPYFLCVGTIGSNKILMRVCADGYN